jgi:hypothetical protein
MMLPHIPIMHQPNHDGLKPQARVAKDDDNGGANMGHKECNTIIGS